MRLLRPALVFLVLCVAIFPQQSARGQRIRSRSSTPTISPYLNLFRRDGAAVDNYNAYVRPEQQFRDAFRRQQAALDRQEVNIRSLEQDVFRFQREGSLHPTGTGAGFLNYSHYYSAGSSRLGTMQTLTRPSIQIRAGQLPPRSSARRGLPGAAAVRPSAATSLPGVSTDLPCPR